MSSHKTEKVKIKPGEIAHVGVVVKNLQKTMEKYWKNMGIGPWNVYISKPPIMKDMKVRGKPVNFSMKLASTKVGPVFFELIEPLEGPSIYREFLDKKGEGIHHLGYNVQDVKGAVEDFKKMGIEVLQSADFGGGWFWYMDTEPKFGVVYELVIFNPKRSLPPDQVYPEK